MRPKRAIFRYWLEDGLVELAQGMILFVAALVAVRTTPPYHGAGLVIIVGSLLAWLAVRSLKKSVTHPRAGYAEPRVRGRDRFMPVFIMLLVLAALSIAPAELGTGRILFGVLGSTLIWASWRSGLARLGAAGSVIVALTGQDLFVPGLLPYAGELALAAGVLLLSGATARVRYDPAKPPRERHDRG